MEVLLISSGIPDRDYPLIGIFEFDQAKALARSGIQVTYFAIDLRSIRRKRRLGIQSGISDGVKWFRYALPVGAIPRKMKYIIGLWALRRLYRRVFQNARPDIVHAHFTDTAYIASRFCAEERIPLVITEHSSEMNKPHVDPDLLKYAKRAYRDADTVIAVGSGLARHIREQTGVTCRVVPNILPVDDFYGVRHDTQKNGFGFVFCGSLIDGKRPLLLLEAFQGVRKRYPDVRLGFIGDGVLGRELESRIRNRHLEQCVTLYGRLSRKEIARVYKEYDCFVLPSLSETFGVAYIEAMAAGLPVIATRCGGPEDYVIPAVGVLTEVDDEAALQDAMEEMLRSGQKYHAEAIRNYVLENFSERVVTEQLKKIYTELLAEGNRAARGRPE